jgi:hypothetical protein
MFMTDGLDYFNYVNNDILNTVRASEKYAFGKVKENEETMKLEDVKVVFNNKVYQAIDINWTQTPGDSPRMTVDTIISPALIVPSIPPLKIAPINPKTLSIKNVIFNPPATIVFWTDNTKTVVKCDQEEYDPEKGLAMAISKKLLGENKYEYYNVFRHWLKKWDKQSKETTVESESWLDKYHRFYKGDDERSYFDDLLP